MGKLLWENIQSWRQGKYSKDSPNFQVSFFRSKVTDNISLMEEVSNKEIEVAIKNMRKEKCSTPDGMPIGLYSDHFEERLLV